MKDFDPRRLIFEASATADDLMKKASKMAEEFFFSDSQSEGYHFKKTEDSLTIEMAAPGYAKDAVDLSVDGNRLTVTIPANKAGDLQYYGTADFKKNFTLPRGTKTNSIVAKYTSGVLRITAPIEEVPAVRVTVI